MVPIRAGFDQQQGHTSEGVEYIEALLELRKKFCVLLR
jgi:hypothetical protein